MKSILHFWFTAMAVISIAYSVNAQTTYYETDFSGNGTNFPNNWTGDINYDDYNWIISTDGLPGDGHPGNVGGNMPAVCFYDSNDDGTTKELISPSINLSSATAPELTFIYYNRFGRTSTAPVKAFASTDNGSNYSEIWSNTDGYGTSWTTITIDLSSFIGFSSVIIKFNTIHSNSASYPYIDNFRVGEPDNSSSCDIPTNLAVSNITSTSASLNWSGSVNDYKYAYGSNPYSPGNNDGTLWSSTSKDISGLDEGTTYNFYVKAVCGAGSESDWTEIQFTTTTTTSVPKVNNKTNINIYPNPNNGKFTINAKLNSYKNVTIEIINITGKVILTKTLNNINYIEEVIDINNVSKGIYYIKVLNNSFVSQEKFIIE